MLLVPTQQNPAPRSSADLLHGADNPPAEPLVAQQTKDHHLQNEVPGEQEQGQESLSAGDGGGKRHLWGAQPQSLPGAVGLQDAPTPGSSPADRHVDLRRGGVLLLPQRQQHVQVGQQRVEQGHSKGQDQQDGFPLLPAAAPRTELLLNLGSGHRGERVAAGSPAPAGRAANTSTRRGAAMGLYGGCPHLPGLLFPPSPETLPWTPNTGAGAPWCAAALTVCMCCEKWCTASTQPSTVPSERAQASSSTAQCPRRWQRLRERKRERCSASSSCKRAVPVLLNVLQVQSWSEGLSCSTEAGPRGLKGKVLVRGWSRGYLQLQSPTVQRGGGC